MKKIKIKKISENIYEIPKEGKMNVPGKIFASEKLMEKIKQDKTLEQIRAVTQLPGILGSAIAMPDAHQGYGLSIGGVVAFDKEKGIISPGAVGFDINCLMGDSKILTEFGSSIKIKDFDRQKSEIEIDYKDRKIKKFIFQFLLPTLNKKNKKIENKSIDLFMFRDSQKVYEIELESGLRIKATSDHPFLTKTGMVNLSEINKKDKLAVNLFEGVEHNGEIDKKQVILAKIMGYMFGDGWLTRSGKSLRAGISGQKIDLENIQKDLERIGINSSIFSRNRDHKIQTKYSLVKFNATNYELHIYSQEFNNLLMRLGMPLGKKTHQKVRVPKWIMTSNILIKRLFLAGFFGAELSSPSTSSRTCFYCPTIDQNKLESLKENAREFLTDIAIMLEEFKIDNTIITELEEYDYQNKKGEKTKRFRLLIKGEEDMLKLWRNIGFEYNEKRKNLANIASLYILLKKRENRRRINIASKIKDYKKRGFKLKEIQRILFGKINSRFIERHYYENAKQRINLNFISFNDFKKNKIKELKKYGVIFDNLHRIKKIEGIHKVYDFNVIDNHNFMANGFVVSNCGVRLLVSNLTNKEFLKKRKEITHQIKRDVPSGVGRESDLNLSEEDLNEVLNQGVNWALENGYATKEDINRIEDNGKIDGADSSKVSQRAKARGKKQLGTLGAGNHFIEIQEIEEIYDKRIAKIFGIEKKGQIVVMVHCGSRGLGHQVASDYMRKFEKEYGFEHLPDRELIAAPINSRGGKEYFSGMAAAANFAFVNRQIITSQIREAFKKFFPKSKLNLVYDIAHNMAKFEEYIIDGKNQIVCVHRKGATRSFGQGRKEIPLIYREVGCPIFIPGSMGTSSYVLVGTKKAEEISFGSTAHGAGRVMSRTQAKRELTIEGVKKELKDKDIYLEAGSNKGITEEAPQAYKDVDEVVRVSHELGIGNLVAKMKPLAVIKG